MKKVSTATAKQNRNFSQQSLTIGLDLGDRSSHYCVLDEMGRILAESKVSTSPNAMKGVFGVMPRSRIALETGTHSPRVSRLLSGLGHEVIVAHARNVRLIGESRRKDDRLDAQTLARLARIDPELLCPVKHRSAKAQADLTLIRARAGLVRARTALVNTARGLAKSYGERLRGCNVRNMNPEKAEALSPELRTALQPLLAALEALSDHIREYNHRRPYEACVRIVCQIPAGNQIRKCQSLTCGRSAIPIEPLGRHGCARPNCVQEVPLRSPQRRVECNGDFSPTHFPVLAQVPFAE